jgi:hypothetical protein
VQVLDCNDGIKQVQTKRLMNMGPHLATPVQSDATEKLLPNLFPVVSWLLFYKHYCFSELWSLLILSLLPIFFSAAGKSRPLIF